MKEGSKVFLKGKYGMYWEVIIKKIVDDKYAMVYHQALMHEQKVRIDKLTKEPSKRFIKESEETEKEMQKAQEILYRYK